MRTAQRTASVAILAVFALTSCGASSGSSREESIDVESSLTTCTTLIERLCYKFRPTGTTEWKLLYEDLNGLNYEWGRQYTLRVRVTERPGSGAADEPSFHTTYQVLSIASSTQVPRSTPFSIRTSSPAFSLAKDTAGQWTFFGLALTCTGSTCRDLESAKSTDTSILLNFDHTNSPGGQLNLTSISPIPR